MSLYHFLNSCKPVLENEVSDYIDVCRRISDHSSICFQPLTCYDFFPMNTIEHRLPSEFPFVARNRVYIMPITSFFLPTLTKDIADFYRSDELPTLVGREFDELEFCQLILLHQPLFEEHLVSSMNINVVYVELDAGAHHLHLFLCLEKTERVWECLAKDYRCPPELLIDSGKGFMRPFTETALYQKLLSCDDPSLLPKFYFGGLYTYSTDLPSDFSLIYELLLLRENASIYLTPWGAADPETSRVCNELMERERGRKQTIEALRKQLDGFAAHPVGNPPVDEMKAYLNFCREEMAADQGVTDFGKVDQQVSYKGNYGGSREEITPTLCLINRVNYFYALALLAVFDDREGKAKYFSELKDLFLFHVQRVEMEARYKGTYVFLGARDDLHYFAAFIYDHVKMLSRYEAFANWLGDSPYNLMEEELLECAYRKKDASFADWLIENCFYGRIQPALFDIIYRNDKQKAADIASRIVPICVSWILTKTCYEDRRTKQMTPSAQIRFIFEHISERCALDTEQYIRRYRKTRPGYMVVYKQLMREYFPTEAET